jgi:hypothetical protein
MQGTEDDDKKMKERGGAFKRVAGGGTGEIVGAIMYHK